MANMTIITLTMSFADIILTKKEKAKWMYSKILFTFQTVQLNL